MLTHSFTTGTQIKCQQADLRRTDGRKGEFKLLPTHKNHALDQQCCPIIHWLKNTDSAKNLSMCLNLSSLINSDVSEPTSVLIIRYVLAEAEPI